jgi:predicted TIM-barrel fold metal-dependent hydrolase
MSERQDWLDLTKEDALDPELPICDPHHHFWHYPTSRYLVDEFSQDISGGHRVLKTVFVECVQFYDEDAPTELQPVGETVTVDRMASAPPIQDQTAIAAGIIGFADLTCGDAVRPVLEEHLQASPRFRGIRFATAWHADERIRNAHTHPAENLLSCRTFRKGLQHVADLGLSFDAWLYHPQLPELTDLARAFPGLNIVLNHMAGPLGIGPYANQREEELTNWRQLMKSLSQCENVSVKLGGRAMKMSGFEWHTKALPPGSRELAAAMSPYFASCIEQFGPERCMFESNFPVDKASCDYTVLWNAFKRVAGAYSDSERRLLLHDTAVRVYRLDH